MAIKKKNKTKVKKKVSKKNKIKKEIKLSTPQLVNKTKPEWIKSSLANKKKYQEKYSHSI